jgi:hypothetical protein
MYYENVTIPFYKIKCTESAKYVFCVTHLAVANVK